MNTLGIVLLGVVVGVCGLILYAVLRVSGMCSDKEDE